MKRLLMFVAGIALAQDPTPPAATTPAAEIPVVVVSTPPLAAVSFTSPYASPRDAARHRLQATLADLTANRNLKEGIRGFAQAFLEDHTYAAAAFNLGIVSVIAGKWEDAASALEEATKLDPKKLGTAAAAQLERVRLIASLERSAEGRRKRRYDEALLRVLDKLPGLSSSEAITALSDLGRIDPKRWEAPALLAGVIGTTGNRNSYQASAKFLEIAAANAGDPVIKQALERALHAAQAELVYISTRAAAEAASDEGNYPKAAELYQVAWTASPARVENGMEAVSSLLLSDDTVHGANLLGRLRDGGDSDTSALATAMLKELSPIEPAASSPQSDAAQFFRGTSSREPVRIAALIPSVDRKSLEVYTRPLPKLVTDAEPVVLLAALAVDPPGNVSLPQLAAPAIAGESPWREISAAHATFDGSVPARSIQNVDLSAGSESARIVRLTTQPVGARIFIGDSSDPTCQTPCDLKIASGERRIRFALDGYRSVEQTFDAGGDAQEVSVALEALRGTIVAAEASITSIKINGVPIDVPSPAEFSLSPGLYRIGADLGGGYHERLVTVQPGARLRLASILDRAAR